ncbi:MAG: phosphoethanolamine transferase [Opitutaceae bacterium]|nr:phosphoethanolamine transferase [Opitutaceae bacterium]
MQETGVETYVIVIGESARRANMGLYGYGRDTTPREDAAVSRMLRFTNAVSPAAGTLASVPLSLCRTSAAEGRGEVLDNPADNVVALANAAGFATFWISKQSSAGLWRSTISDIAGMAGKLAWVRGKHDGAALPELDAALASPGRKLILLHIDGSHEPPGEKYPRAFAKFTGGNGMDDEYDNSIHYTDHLIGEIFARLAGARASVLYYSDHALMRAARRGHFKYRYVFGRKAYREAFEIPLWIWWSPAVSAPVKTGVINGLYSTGNNYLLIRDWLGVTLGGDKAPSPLRDGWEAPERVRVWVSEKDPAWLDELKSEREAE